LILDAYLSNGHNTVHEWGHIVTGCKKTASQNFYNASFRQNGLH